MFQSDHCTYICQNCINLYILTVVLHSVHRSALKLKSLNIALELKVQPQYKKIIYTK